MDELLKKIQNDLVDFNKKFSTRLSESKSKSESLSKACSSIAESWSGSFAGWHGLMYFRDFQRPTISQKFNGEWGGIHGIPEGWEEKDAKSVAGKISDIIGGFSVEDFENEIMVIRKAIGDLMSEISISISALDLESLQKEKQLADKIDIYSLGEPRMKFANNQIPKSVMTRDSEALRQGTCIPSHVYYSSIAYEAEKTAEAFEEYNKLVTRMIKQIQLKLTIPKIEKKDNKISYGIHQDIKDKCISLYESEAYAEAVEKSFKVVRDRLRKLTGHETGSEAFGKGKLHIIGAAAHNVDSDFNKAAQFLMMAIDMFRNEKSHTSDAKIDDPIRAYQYLVMSSLALALLDNSEIKI